MLVLQKWEANGQIRLPDLRLNLPKMKQVVVLAQKNCYRLLIKWKTVTVYYTHLTLPTNDSV